MAKRENRKKGQSRASNSDRTTPPTVVGIGASAGGLNALKELFRRVPADSGLAFVVVVHLSPDHKSHLADLLQPSVKFPVRQVHKTVSLETNNVYVIPPNANLSAIDTHLRLAKLEENRRERAPIDHFFRTLASTHDGHSIGLILTGTGSDGTLGLKEIKAKGGVILVQDPNEAEFDGMPQSAIATGLVDRVLPLAEIPDVLLRLAKIAPNLNMPVDEEGASEPGRSVLPKVIAVLKARTDRDFSRYKAATLLRRIARRMQLNYIDEYDQYLEFLREQPDEARALGDDLLITVTSFFRDPDVFAKLEQDVIPHLFEGKESLDTVRVWSVGCATGEEAYSLAMLLQEEATRREAPPKIQIFASDLHKRSLDSAREGMYPGDIQADVSPARLKRFFHRENGGYRISKELRDIVVFAPHNLLSDPPFSRLDLIACRNLMIYLDRSVQRDVVDLFHYALCSNGYLLLGSAETVDASDLFRPEDKKLCLYRKRNVPAPEPRLPVFPITRFHIPTNPQFKGDATSETIPYPVLHQKLLGQYAPPSILISPDNKLVHLSEQAGRYLVHPAGETTLSVLRLVREELRIELQALLQSARNGKEMLDSRPISVRFNGHAAPVVMHVQSAQGSDHDGYVLIIFEERQPEPEHQIGGAAALRRAKDLGEASKHIAQLEAEVENGRQRLQATIEEYETSREEMKASQEEMQSTNEELRSTMEELETSKEELQSINEELQTVNQENRHKVEELSQLSSDIQNLLTSTEIATLFVDRQLRILRFTPRLADLFNIRVTDRGRPIMDLTHRLGYAELRHDAQSVLDKLIPVQREIKDEAGRWYLTRVLPYRSTEDRIEGVVITFVEITDRKMVEDRLRESEMLRRMALSGGRMGTWRWDLKARLTWGDAQFLALLGLPPTQEAITLTSLERVSPKGIKEMEAKVTRASGSGEELEGVLEIVTGPTAGRSIQWRGSFEPHSSTLSGVAFDITEQKRAEAQLRAVEERQTFLLKLSDALRPLTDAEQLRSTACRLLGEHVSASRVYYVDFDPKQNIGTVSRDYATAGLPSLAGIYPFENFRSTYDRIKTGKAWVVADLTKEAEIHASEREFYLTQQVMAWTDIPMMKGGRVDAVLCVVQTTARQWTEEEVALIYNVADRLWSAVERAQIESALRLAEENQRRLLEGMPQLVWRSKDDGWWTWSSPQWQAFTGQTIAESQGHGWLDALHPDDVQTAVRAWASVKDTGQFDVDYRIREQHTGSYRCHHTRSVPIRDDHGSILEWLGTSTDIEDLKQAEAARKFIEEQFRLFVDNVQEYALVQTDITGRITHWNPGASRLFGFKPEEMVGKNFEALMTEEDQAQRIFAHELTYVTEGHRNEDARWFVRKDGSRFWARWITEPIHNAAGTFIGLAKVMRDETERERAAAITEGALAEKEELLKEVHHRVKNNLQVITSLLNLQADQIADQQTLAAFDEARNRVSAIASIHELLYRSSSLAAINLADYARQFASNLLNFYGMQNRVRIEVRGDGATLELERAVPYGLLLNELLSNALKHAFPQDRAGRILVSLEEEGNSMLLRVADDGIGSPAGFNVENVSSLGLKLVQKLARQLQGEVHFRSDDAGTVVEVTFPLRAV